MLVTSGLCCLVAPFVLPIAPGALLAVFLGVWGFAVVGDSPQFSALSARAAPPELVGTGLAFVTSVGFALTVVSLQVATFAPPRWIPWVLLPGPVIGAWGLRLVDRS